MTRLTVTQKVIACGTLAILAGGAAFMDSMANVLERSNPQAALIFNSDQPSAVSRIINLRAATRNPPLPIGEDIPMIRRGLAARPLSADLLRQLAQAIDGKTLSNDSRRLLALSDKVSRRDEAAQLLLAQNFAREGELDSAMVSLSTALTTSRRADEEVFPLLISFLDAPQGRDVFVPFLEKAWMRKFLEKAAQDGPIDEVYRLVLADPNIQRDRSYRDFRRELISQLSQQGFNALAIDYARRAGGRAPMEKKGFDEITTDQMLAPVSWRLSNSNDIYSIYEGGRIVVEIEPSAAGTAIDRLFAVQPGDNTATLQSTIENGGRELDFELTIECATKDGYTELASKSIGTRGAVARFTVQRGCGTVRAIVRGRNNSERSVAVLSITDFVLQGPGEN